MTAKWRGRFVMVAAAVTLVACDKSPTAPSVPQVAGSYTGTVTLVFPELAVSGTCPGNTTVTQSGSTVNIAPIILGGECGNLSLPVGQAQIDSTGAIVSGGNSDSFTDPSCGVYNVTGSGGFFNRELRMSVNATSATCWNLNMTISLFR